MASLQAIWRFLRSVSYSRLIPLALGVAVVLALNPFAGNTQDVCGFHPEAYEGLNPSALEAELTSTGLLGRIHGAAAEAQLYVLSVREPNNFFSHMEYSLIPQTETEAETLQKLARHDLVCVRGEISTNPSPQPHIAVQSIHPLETWEGLDGFQKYERETGIPDELRDRQSFVGKVHAIGADGKILVVEYKDAVLPIFIPSGDIAQTLYRGDIIRLSYTLQTRPNRPVHLVLDSSADTPIEMVSGIADWNGQTKTLTGKLVKFPQSPQISLDVYALEVETEAIKRYFTLVNFEDMGEFQAIIDKLATIWDDRADSAIAGRNWLVEPDVTLEATGEINMMSPEQANPQILLDSSADIHLL